MDSSSVTFDIINMLSAFDNPDASTQLLKSSNALIERLKELDTKAAEWEAEYSRSGTTSETFRNDLEILSAEVTQLRILLDERKKMLSEIVDN